MIRISLIAVTLALLLGGMVPFGEAHAQSDWDYYRIITIDHTAVSGSGDLESFPVLISMTKDWLKHTSNGGDVGRSDGYDIVFTDSSNSQLLDYEIEKYDGATGQLVAWVRIPTLSGSEDTQIRIWYGNADASDWSNPPGVWDSNFKMVQHLEETSQGSGSYDDHLDSTSYDNHGEIGSSSEVTMDTTGKINGANDFSGTGDSYADVADSESLDITGSFTLEAWTKLDNDGHSRR